MPNFGITHESGRLRRVMVHRPGTELEKANLDPKKHNFDGPVNIERFISQHKQLVDALIEAGVEVLDVGTLVASDAAISAQVAQCPNLVFTRDSSVVTDAGAILMRMGLPSRRLETPIIRTVYQILGVPIGLALEDPSTFEGGGFALIEGRVAVAGLCSRTTPDALEAVKNFLFEHRVVDTFIVLNLPPGDIHIDGDFAELPDRIAIVHPKSLEYAPADFYTRSESWKASFVDWLKDEGWNILEITDEERFPGAAANFLTVDHDLAIHYEGNPRVMREVREHGIEVVQIRGDELIKGNGGVHCMTCPVLRT
jgi:N-dimethylarginine dimethylaminohydrolase